ncbi:hypothetical protein Mgra_00004428 [Meloidogyne graminicola]|nr:hypothetical protein Mgra_00004428 [Meloidogyne graminicola]
MVNICNLYNKACAEFSLPLRLKQPNPYDFRRLQRISEMIKGYLPYKNEVNRECFGNNSKQSESMYNENINNGQLNKLSKPKLAEGINGGFQVQNNNSFQNNNNQIKTNESIQNNRKRPIINGYTSSFPNVSPSINSSIKISPSLSVQPPSTSVNMNLILNEKFGYSSPIVAVNLNSPQVNNFNQIKQWNKQIINSNITNNNNCYENNNVQIINGNTQKKFFQQPIQWKPIPTNGENKKTTTTIQQNHSHNLRSLSNIEKLNSKQQQFTTPTASVVIVSGQELLLHELSPINNKKTKFTQQKTCDEVEVIEID